MYGRKFADMWVGVDVDVAKRMWSVGLDGYSADELAAGLRACMGRDWPPSLPEFAQLARPLVDAESLFCEAQRALCLGDWSGNRLAYWVTQCVGPGDVRSATWFHIRRRWEKALADALTEGALPAIPDQREQLPAPGRTTSRDVAREELAKMRAKLGMREAA